MAFNAFDGLTFLTILLMTFALFLVITGPSRPISEWQEPQDRVGLLIGGLIVGLLWAGTRAGRPGVDLLTVIAQSIGVILAAIIGAAAAIGLFLWRS